MSRENQEAPVPEPARRELGPPLPLGFARLAAGNAGLLDRLRITG